MALAWEDQKRLLRVAGLAEQLLAIAQGGDRSTRDGLEAQVRFLTSEVHDVLAAGDAQTADEFERVVVRGPDAEVPAELRAAALVGWLKAALTTQALDERRDEEAARVPRRKQTLGFKFRSPITREQAVVEQQGDLSEP